MIGDNYLNFEEIYDLVEHYPIDFSEGMQENYDEKFYWSLDANSPRIVILSHPEGEGERGCTVHIPNEGKTMWLKVLNYSGSFTITANILENSCLNFLERDQEEAFAFRYGEWEDNNTLPLYITKLNLNCKAHGAEIKFYLAEDPSCAAMLSLI